MDFQEDDGAIHKVPWVHYVDEEGSSYVWSEAKSAAQTVAGFFAQLARTQIELSMIAPSTSSRDELARAYPYSSLLQLPIESPL